MPQNYFLSKRRFPESNLFSISRAGYLHTRPILQAGKRRACVHLVTAFKDTFTLIASCRGVRYSGSCPAGAPAVTAAASLFRLEPQGHGLFRPGFSAAFKQVVSIEDVPILYCFNIRVRLLTLVRYGLPVCLLTLVISRVYAIPLHQIT